MKGRADTWVIRLTGPGRSAVASLLVTGPGSTQIVRGLFHPFGNLAVDALPLGRIAVGRWGSASEGEEVVLARIDDEQLEIHCHGGDAAAGAMIDSLLNAGCQTQSWQDWLAQQVVDPLAAEANVALALATTECTALVLLDQQQGALRAALQAVEAQLDQGHLEAAVREIEQLLAWAPLGAHLTVPWRVVLAGAPNVGKSSLINALVGYERSIVHATAGTTRDVVTSATAIEGWPIELADTAGLRGTLDPLEAAGVQLAEAQLRAADLVLLVFDATRPWTQTDQALAEAWPRALLVQNKCDLLAQPSGAPGLPVSAQTGQGLAALERAIAQRLVPQSPKFGQAIPFSPRHVERLGAARQQLLAGNLPGARQALGSL